ncbi:MAG TPA: hypothetical protein VMR19_02185 [Candidatus Saccharimonadales bacterium]|nr:hypothetical protein [Candidatus Saccharimonadales bacterium]
MLLKLNKIKLFDKLIIPIVLLILLAILAYLFVKHEKFIYYWDLSAYYNYYLNFNDIIKGDKLFDVLLFSIRINEYNFLAALPLVTLKTIFGSNRIGFIESILFVYGFPSILLLSLLLKNFVFSIKQKLVNNSSFLLILLLAIPPLFFGPILRGYVDVVVVIPAIILIIIAFKELSGKGTFLSSVLMGLLLFLGPVLRRWFLIWSLSYLISLLLIVLIKHLIMKQVDWKKLFVIVSHFIIAVTTFYLLTHFFAPLFMADLNNTFLTQISAYKTGESVIEKVIYQIRQIGLIYLPFFIVGLISGLRRAKGRFFSLFLLLLMITSTSIFIRIQDVMDHHTYLYLPIVIFFVAIGFYEICFSGYKKIKIVVIPVYILLVLISYSIVFIPNINLRIEGLPQWDNYPLVRYDLNTVDKMIDYLASLINSNYGKVYVLSSSEELNDSIIQNRAKELGYVQLSDNILYTQEVDKRDGFPSNLFDARYILLTQPTGYHLDPSEQRSIGILHDYVASNNRIFFKLTDCYYLENNVCAEIYMKKDEPPLEDIETLKNDFILTKQ